MTHARKHRSESDERSLVLTRIFDAPRELAFKAWTDPAHVAHWWGPHGFTTTIHEMDVRPGGVWRFVMHGPDGVDYPNRVVYREVVSPERLVYLHGSQAAGADDEFEVTVTFEDDHGRTRLTMRMQFKSAAERERVVREYGALEGGQQTLERLGAYLATLA